MFFILYHGTPLPFALFGCNFCAKTDTAKLIDFKLFRKKAGRNQD
jgi:hypothetical protein